ncbi:hypothetical protein Pla8534_63160 [Lignipirellula cremea]|uniref:Uncharacterized protein n=2 Tax=Lignipirellula cremea TaxID=2528010 RepID=A0A518E2Z1_9BACT|nr:hypothetical protein Pla8534_63160 [Lignipirellula cremea]
MLTNLGLGYMSGDFNGIAQRHRQAYQTLDQARKSGDEARRAAAEKEFDEVSAEYRPLSNYKVAHFMLGVLAALVVVLVNSITVTYFIGTTRWVREVCDAYLLSDEYPQRSDRLKRKAFPWAVIGIVTMMAIVMLGAAADPSADIDSSADWVLPHHLAAILGTCVIAFAFFMQISSIAANYEVIQEIVAEVRRIRAEKGLDT